MKFIDSFIVSVRALWLITSMIIAWVLLICIAIALWPLTLAFLLGVAMSPDNGTDEDDEVKEP